MANASCLGGFFPKKLSDNKFMGVIIFPNNTELAFDDDNVKVLLHKDNGETLLSLTGFTGDKEFLNGHVFLAKANVMALIIWK